MDERINVGGITIRRATPDEEAIIRQAMDGGVRPFRLLGGGLIFFRDTAGAYYGAHEDAVAGELVAIPPSPEPGAMGELAISFDFNAAPPESTRMAFLT